MNNKKEAIFKMATDPKVKKFVETHIKEFEVLDLETIAEILDAIAKGKDYNSLRNALYAVKLRDLSAESLLSRLEQTASLLEGLSKEAKAKEEALITLFNDLYNVVLK